MTKSKCGLNFLAHFFVQSGTGLIAIAAFPTGVRMLIKRSFVNIPCAPRSYDHHAASAIAIPQNSASDAASASSSSRTRARRSSPSRRAISVIGNRSTESGLLCNLPLSKPHRRYKRGVSIDLRAQRARFSGPLDAFRDDAAPWSRSSPQGVTPCTVPQ
jgi:hypothetical protein